LLTRLRLTPQSCNFFIAAILWVCSLLDFGSYLKAATFSLQRLEDKQCQQAVASVANMQQHLMDDGKPY